MQNVLGKSTIAVATSADTATSMTKLTKLGAFGELLITDCP